MPEQPGEGLEQARAGLRGRPPLAGRPAPAPGTGAPAPRSQTRLETLQGPRVDQDAGVPERSRPRARTAGSARSRRRGRAGSSRPGVRPRRRARPASRLLPDPGLAEDGEDATVSGPRRGQRLVEPRHLAVATDERRLGRPGRDRRPAAVWHGPLPEDLPVQRLGLGLGLDRQLAAEDLRRTPGTGGARRRAARAARRGASASGARPPAAGRGRGAGAPSASRARSRRRVRWWARSRARASRASSRSRSRSLMSQSSKIGAATPSPANRSPR